jgi:hypothetical protein
MTQLQHFSNRQVLFKELFVGALIYAVVLGFLDDYTGIVKAKSFSTIFFSATVLQVLTIGAFILKKRFVAYFKAHKGSWAKVGMIFSVWLVMFLSKFVFIGALDLVFGSYISINGFFGILLVVVLVTVIHKLADYIFNKLADTR